MRKSITTKAARDQPSPERADNIAPREKPWYKRVDVWLSTIPAILGLVLSITAIYEARWISEQQTTIKGFEELLKSEHKLNIESDTLVKRATIQLRLTSTTNELVGDQIAQLKAQLSLNTKIQNEANINADYLKRSNRNKLYAATSNLGRIKLRGIDSTSLVDYISQVKPILEEELLNPYLLQNEEMEWYWEHAYITVEGCRYVYFDIAHGGKPNYVFPLNIENVKTCQWAILDAEYIIRTNIWQEDKSMKKSADPPPHISPNIYNAQLPKIDD
jgi:hypothetical protein